MKLMFVLLALFLGTSAYATPAQCLLQVDGTTYLNGDCNFSAFGEDGSFSMGTDDPGNRYFAYVIMYEGVANASWNGVEAASHAHNSLGEMKRNGACRYNDRAIICAWAK